jgi:hypothetical protein
MHAKDTPFEFLIHEISNISENESAARQYRNWKTKRRACGGESFNHERRRQDNRAREMK